MEEQGLCVSKWQVRWNSLYLMLNTISRYPFVFITWSWSLCNATHKVHPIHRFTSTYPEEYGARSQRKVWQLRTYHIDQNVQGYAEGDANCLVHFRDRPGKAIVALEELLDQPVLHFRAANYNTRVNVSISSLEQISQKVKRTNDKFGSVVLTRTRLPYEKWCP